MLEHRLIIATSLVVLLLAASATADPIQLSFEPEEKGGVLILENTSLFPVTVSLTIPETVRYKLLTTNLVTIPPKSKVASHHLLTNDNFEPMVHDIDRAYLDISKNVFSLPCEPTNPCRVSQSQFGQSKVQDIFIHEKWARFAVDFDMPENSAIYAVSSGKVILVVDTNSENCTVAIAACVAKANRILVLNSDLSIVEYLHLAQASARFSPGDTLTVGDHIANVGNTGFSSAPHLHLALLAATKDLKETTLPMAFCTNSGIKLLEQNIAYIGGQCE